LTTPDGFFEQGGTGGGSIFPELPSPKSMSIIQVLLSPVLAYGYEKLTGSGATPVVGEAEKVAESPAAGNSSATPTRKPARARDDFIYQFLLSFVTENRRDACSDR
jgi:hypothetical protein